MKQVTRWLPDAAAALATFVLGMAEVNRYAYDDPWVAVLVVAGIALAVGLSRALPGVALAAAWVTAGVQVQSGTHPLLTQVLLATVAFGCARWGRIPTVWLSGLSIPLAAVVAVVWLSPYEFYEALQIIGIDGIAADAYRTGRFDWRLIGAVVGIALLATPWLLGLALRFAARSELSRRSQVAAEAQRDQAEEIAQLREEQAQLARDVHDVVGHSLAVILAQAESAQYLEDADTQGLKITMSNIATSARSSLDDVRQVLSSTASQNQGQTPPATRHADLDSLVDGVRASGHEVVTTEVGTPQPLPPELGVVAFRVLQEMLTNAIKHGRRDRPVLVERHWEGDLRIEVQNAVPEDLPHLAETQPIALAASAPPTLPPPTGGGQGLDGMRRRLEAVGGHLDVRRRTDPPTFTATAWVPMRSR
ncbi:sensor histidine kinase [Pimelobacter simplex]|uniref:sensor histidine kinase n=1 Tax=Nocardioides simplex TaxID=2045 RepID=UPI00214F8DBD|nr:histidine kinase [Pimelobacter simplex]UUW91109.1 histidine kinase [Pimelobacter simplex]UUW94937.1 histidine kinase [Pimelobacter simplex]